MSTTESLCPGKIRLAETNQPTIEPEVIKSGSTMLASTDAERMSAPSVIVEDPAHLSLSSYKQGIADFLAKPMLVNTITMNASTIVSTLLWSGSILTMLKSNPIWMNKLSGSAQIKAKAILTLQINASPYNAGALMLHFVPNYVHADKTHDTRKTLMQRSQQPNMRIDIATTKEITMEIPYVAPTEYCDLTTGLYDWGTAFIVCWSDFTTGSAAPTSCTGTIWLSFVDVDIQNAIVPQSQVKKGQRGRVKPFDSKAPTPSEQEKGPISKTLSAISVMSSTLSTIPLLAPVAGPVAWFTSVASGVASAFGWSKPLNDNYGSRMIEGAHFGAPNCNGIDQSQPLSLFSDNKVRIMSDLSGDGLDHMSINYIKSIPTFLDAFDLNYSDTPGIKRSVTLSPASFAYSRTVATVGATAIPAVSATPLWLLSRLYANYRGSIILRFHIHKTQFHTGRIMFAFSPVATTAPSLANTAYLHRAIMDLSLTNEACFTFPYLSNLDYLDTDSAIGTCYIYVVNPLRGPDAVSSRVQVSIEVFGGPDMEFQIPRPTSVMPIVAQMGGDATSTVPNLCSGIGAVIPNEEVQGASQYTIGEHSTSLLQLLKRYVCSRLPGSTFPGGALGLTIFPFSTTAYQNNTPPVLGGDYLTLISSMFLYSRGGVRYRFATSESPLFSMYWLVANSTNKGAIVSNLDLSSPTNANAGLFCHKFSSGGVAVQVPHYGRTYTRLNHLATPSGGYGPDSPGINLAISSTTGGVGTAPAAFIVTRAAADDFQLSYFIGVPDMYFP